MFKNLNKVLKKPRYTSKSCMNDRVSGGVWECFFFFEHFKYPICLKQRKTCSYQMESKGHKK